MMYRVYGAGEVIKRLNQLEQKAAVDKADHRFLADIGFGEGTRLLPYPEMIQQLKHVYTPRAIAERLKT
jgi:hypothetical protein